MAPILAAAGVSKSFPGVQALDGVDFDLRPGEVHALCGENGAGKSTLMKILAGGLHPDQGQLRLAGAPVRFANPLAARRAGVLLIHQEISLVPELSVAENIYLGALPQGRFGQVDRKALAQKTSAVLEACGCDVAPGDLVGKLSVARRQSVELARAWAFESSVVIFDEPTAALTDSEAETLFSNIARLKARGVGVVYISHKMAEIFRLSDRITVLRDGRIRGALTTAETSQDEVAELMIGRPLDRYITRPPRHTGPELLRVEGLSTPGWAKDVSFAIGAGEVVGLYGLVGAGRSETAEAIMGLRPRSSGVLSWKGEPQPFGSPAEAIGLGIGFVPEDRKSQGLVLGLGGRANVSLAVLSQLSRWGVVRPRAERELYGRYRDRLDIRAASPETPVGKLSGGNQQKVVLAKWLAAQPQLLILDEPTRGVDVGAKAQIYALISDLAADGMAILLISSEMPEVLGLSHRILTFRQGTLTGELDGASATERQLIANVMHPTL